LASLFFPIADFQIRGEINQNRRSGFFWKSLKFYCIRYDKKMRVAEMNDKQLIAGSVNFSNLLSGFRLLAAPVLPYLAATSELSYLVCQNSRF
jgi:hypothetical protein